MCFSQWVTGCDLNPDQKIEQADCSLKKRCMATFWQYHPLCTWNNSLQSSTCTAIDRVNSGTPCSQDNGFLKLAAPVRLTNPIAYMYPDRLKMHQHCATLPTDNESVEGL